MISIAGLSQAQTGSFDVLEGLNRATLSNYYRQIHGGNYQYLVTTFDSEDDDSDSR